MIRWIIDEYENGSHFVEFEFFIPAQDRYYEINEEK